VTTEWLTVERPLELWSQERAWTRRLVAAFPESAFGWRPAPDAFACGELVAPLVDMIWFMASHEVHHRGQLSAYAKMLGVPQPPIYVGSF